MAERHSSRKAGILTQRAYALRPVRSLAFRATVWAVAGVLCASAGAVVATAWHVRRAGMPPAQCTVAPVDGTAQQKELIRARLALAEESAARAVVQKTADSAAADVARLNAEVQFLRGQSKGRSPEQRAAPRR